jgi:hypothetical protein
MKKWLITASIIVVASSALCLPVMAEPKNEKVPSTRSVETWWVDIGGRRAFGTVPDVKLGELNGSGLFDPATMSMVAPAGASRDPALFYGDQGSACAPTCFARRRPRSNRSVPCELVSSGGREAIYRVCL